MTFWGNLKEAVLEWLIGTNQLQYWRTEKKHRAEWDRLAQAQYDKYRRIAAGDYNG